MGLVQALVQALSLVGVRSPELAEQLGDDYSLTGLA
jgi:hypothetical protein